MTPVQAGTIALQLITFAVLAIDLISWRVQTYKARKARLARERANRSHLAD